jgi:8-oxo-dGTP pyrophosphatase MutT (NUDIX family)
VSGVHKRGVVICCRREDGRWLLIRRAKGVQRAPLKVGFPGGEVHESEDPADAVRRESFEELGLAVQPIRCVWVHDMPPWHLMGWLGQLPAGALKPNPEEVAELLWLDEAEARVHPDGLPTLASIFDALHDIDHAGA